MPIERWSEQVSVIRLADDPQFSDDLAAVEREPAPIDAVLDFAQVEMISSSNIARLLMLRKCMSAARRRLVLCNVSTQVWGAFLTTGLDRIFEFSADVTTSLATLKMS